VREREREREREPHSSCRIFKKKKHEASDGFLSDWTGFGFEISNADTATKKQKMNKKLTNLAA